jgi:hypothetical protein
MTEILIITVVSSVLGTLTFGYLVWLGLGLRKALSQSSENLDRIRGLHTRLDEVNRYFTQEISKKVQMLQDVDADHAEYQRLTNNGLIEEINNVRKEVDRRFDRVYHKLYTEFPQLKEVEQPTEY